MKVSNIQISGLVVFLMLAMTQAFVPHPCPPILSQQLYMSEPETDNDGTVDEAPKPAVKCPDCDLCDGSGRILGGLGAIFPWMPVKAYRPCPNFVERGGAYERSGQGLDEIAFGRDSTFKKDS